MSTLKKLASQTAIYGLSSIVGRLINYLLVPLYTNTFLPAEYGVVTELYAYTAFLNVLLTFGMETAFFRYAQQEGIDKQKVFSTSLMGVGAVAISFIMFGFLFNKQIASLLKYDDYNWYIKTFILITGMEAISAIPFARLRDENRPLKFALVRLTNIFVNIFFNLFYLVFCPWWNSRYSPLPEWLYAPYTGVGYIFLSNLFASAVTLLLLIPEFRIRYYFDRAIWKSLIRYALPLLLVGLAGMTNETSDRILLKYLLPAGTDVMAATGIYGACYKISIIMTIFIQTFRYAAEPFFFNHAKNKDSKEVYGIVMNYFIIACAVIFLATMLYMDVVKHFVGKKYWEGLYIVPVLLLANWCLGIYYNLTIWYKLTNKTLMGARIAVFGAILTLLFNFLLIPHMGYYGAAWTTLICYSGMMIMSFIQGRKHYPVPYDLPRAGMYILLPVLLYLISYLWQDWGTVSKHLLNTCLFMAFMVFIYLMERKQFNKVIV